MINKWNQIKNKERLIVYLLFGASVIVRFLCANFYPRTINCYPDELLYYSIGESLWNDRQVMIYNLPSSFEKIGYAALLAPLFSIENIQQRLTLIAFANAFVISLGVFPVYHLAKRILDNNKHRLLCVALYLIAPTMTYSMTYMSEVLYVPLSLFVLWFTYGFIESVTVSKKALWAVGMVMGIGLAYLTKTQAIVFPAALIASYITVGMFEENKKVKCVSVALFVVGILGTFMVFTSGYMGVDTAFVNERFEYIVFGVIFYGLIVLMSFMFVPIFLPAISFGEMEKKDKRFFFVLIYYVLLNAVIVACLIYTREDYPSMTPRTHVRYVEFLFVPFVILLFHVMEKRREKKLGVVPWSAMAIFSLMLLLVFSGFSGQTIDQTMLFYWQLLSEDGTTFLPYKVKIACVIIVIALVIMLNLYEKNKLAFEKIFVVGMILVCLFNNVLSIYVQYKTHTHSEAETKEAEQIREFAQEHRKDEILFIEPENQDELMDTLLVDCSNVSVQTNLQNIHTLPAVSRNTTKPKYIVICNGTGIELTDLELVRGYQFYSIYRSH